MMGIMAIRFPVSNGRYDFLKMQEPVSALWRIPFFQYDAALPESLHGRAELLGVHFLFL